VCIKAKTRCDIALPSCSRCTTKGLQCLYKSSNAPSTSGVQGVPVDEHVTVVHHVEAGRSQNYPTEQTTPDSNHIFGRGGNSPYNLRFLFETNNFDPPLSTDPWVDLQSNPGTGNVDGTVRSTLPAGTTFSNGMLDLVSSGPLSWSCPADAFLLAQIHYFKDRVILGSYYVVNLSPSFVSLDPKTILEKRDFKAGPYGSALGRAYCISTLRSYPGMLCGNDGTLPSFIHLQSRRSSWKSDFEGVGNHVVAPSGPLAICSSIMQMYMAKSPGNLAFIWRTIQAESQRIEDEVSIMS
jgi:hypothetical protein